MSHRIHEPNHAGECIFCGKYVGKDMNKTPNPVHIGGGYVNESDAGTNIPIKPGSDISATTKPTIRGDKPMTNHNKRLDKILDDLYYGGLLGPDTLYPGRAKQAIASLIKELVAEAKPKTTPFDNNLDDGYATDIRSNAINEFEQNLLKALEEV